MPRGKRTSLPQAAQAKALADIGYQGTQIADPTGLPVRTVDDIINGRNGWREIIANDQAFKQYRTQAKRQMQATSINLSQKALQQIENRIDKPVRHKPQWSTASCATRSGSTRASQPRSWRCTHEQRLKVGCARRDIGADAYREGKRSM